MATRKQEPRASAPDEEGGFSLISDEKLLQLYATMVKCRLIEERAQGRLEPKKPLEPKKLASRSGGRAAGQAAGLEAVVVGVAIDLGPEDTVAPSSHGPIADFGTIAGFVKGEPREEIFRRQAACAAALDPAVRLDIATDALNIATGAALVNKTKNNGKIAVVFLDGEAAAPVFRSGSRPDSSSDSFADALHVAGLHRLPILFVRLSSLPAGAGKGKAQEGIDAHAGREGIARLAEECGIPFIAVDASDAVAVYRVATEAITHARKGNGATLIECETAGGGKAHDPILKMEVYLTRKGLFSEGLKSKTVASFTKELKAALATANQSKRLTGR
jgi:TPP-dependent pyruvate/acetoin dehydrogenase alpha subunit